MKKLLTATIAAVMAAGAIAASAGSAQAEPYRYHRDRNNNNDAAAAALVGGVLGQALGARHEAAAYFTDKGHDLFAAVQGELVADNDPAMIDRLWNRFVAAWFEGGKSDPNLQLLRFTPDRAQIWLNENSLLAGVKLLLGSDPKKDYQDKVADVRLN